MPTAVTFTDPFADYAGALVGNAPEWFFAVLLPAALIGSLGFASATGYSAGPHLDAIIPRLTRSQATTIVAVAAIGQIILGALAFEAQDSIVPASLHPGRARDSLGRHLRHRLCSMPWSLPPRRPSGLKSRPMRRRRLLVHPRLEPEGGCRLPLRGRIGLLAGNKTRYKDPIAAIADGVDLGFIGSLVASAVYLLLPRRTMSESADRSRADSCFVPECESRPRLAPYERWSSSKAGVCGPTTDAFANGRKQSTTIAISARVGDRLADVGALARQLLLLLLVRLRAGA